MQGETNALHFGTVSNILYHLKWLIFYVYSLETHIYCPFYKNWICTLYDISRNTLCYKMWRLLVHSEV